MEEFLKTFGIPAIVAALVSALMNFRMNSRLALRKELNDEITTIAKKIREITAVSIEYWGVDGRDEPKELSIILKLKEGRTDLLSILDRLDLRGERSYLLAYSDFWEEITSGNFQSNNKTKDHNKIQLIAGRAEDIITDIRTAFTDKYCKKQFYN